jgi:PPOX class probable FMN-dependent enzyme
VIDHRAGALTSEDELRALYEPPSGLAATKELDHLDEMCRRLIGCSPLVMVASADADGRCDVTPRGGPPGFVAVLDDHHLAVPDATGNRRIDTIRNVVANGHAGLLFLIPGRGQTLRVNGGAWVTAERALLERLTPVGKAPRSALVVRADEVFAHCPKAFVRSGAWRPETWLEADAQPSPAEVSHAHARDPGLSVAEVAEMQAESLRSRLL